MFFDNLCTEGKKYLMRNTAIVPTRQQGLLIFTPFHSLFFHRDVQRGNIIFHTIYQPRLPRIILSEILYEQKQTFHASKWCPKFCCSKISEHCRFNHTAYLQTLSKQIPSTFFIHKSDWNTHKSRIPI